GQGTGDRSQGPGVRNQWSGVASEALVESEEDEVPVSSQSSARVSDPEATAERGSPEPEPVGSLPPRLVLEDWDLEPQLRATERLLKGLRQEAPPESITATHSAHEQSPGWHGPESRVASTVRAPREREVAAPPEKPEKSGTLAWTCLSLGVMALACGGVLIAWSLIAGRDDLWSIGLPLAVVGQGVLVIGLLLQLDGLWQSSKKTEETLTQLDGKLHDLAHTTTMLGTTRSTPAQSFYVHMAEGASPHLLLADLKGQLDLLAERMARK
ncbi:MAG: hypothetical protein K8R36_04000, partial [Planctomycetales bacterium]|nr:hypothetical protein [Planctomycetales bacterium]